MISVIVPVYNVEAYVETCIQSICGQTFPELEILLVDDGSTDRSGAICQEWAQKDSRIRVIRKENGGLSDARNAAMAVARGQWWMFVDGDDYLAPEAAETMLTAAEAYGCAMAVGNMERVYDDGGREPFYAPVQTLTVWDGQQRFETLKQPSVCNKLFRAELFRDVRFPKGKYYEDTFVYHVLAHRAQKIVLTGQTGYFYLSRRESILGQPRYTDRYFDFVEAVYTRMTYLLAQQIDDYGQEACLSLYGAVANGEKYVKKTQENAEKFQKMRQWYEESWNYLRNCPEIGFRQKLRLWLLRHFPGLHSRIY